MREAFHLLDCRGEVIDDGGFSICSTAKNQQLTFYRNRNFTAFCPVFVPLQASKKAVNQYNGTIICVKPTALTLHRHILQVLPSGHPRPLLLKPQSCVADSPLCPVGYG